MEISPQIDKKVDEIIAQYPVKRSAAMMIMHLIQESNGYFDDSAIKYAAQKLGVQPVVVYGMLSFYPMFSDKPRGRIHIKVCRTLSCALAGSIELADKISKIIDCPINETEGVYTLEFVECLGNCVKGPNVQVNDKLFENVKPEEAEDFVKKIRAMDESGELAPRSAFDAPYEDINSPAYKG